MNNALLEACALMDVRRINRADAHTNGIRRDSRPKPIKSKPSHRPLLRGYILNDILYADAAHTIYIRSLAAPKARTASVPKLDIDGYKPLVIPAFARAPKYYPGKRRAATA